MYQWLNNYLMNKRNGYGIYNIYILYIMKLFKHHFVPGTVL